MVGRERDKDDHVATDSLTLFHVILAPTLQTGCYRHPHFIREESGTWGGQIAHLLLVSGIQARVPTEADGVLVADMVCIPGLHYTQRHGVGGGGE